MNSKSENNDNSSGDAKNSSATCRVVDDSQHPIKVADIDREALKVLFRLRDAGFSGYLVGGGVRDLYIGKRPKDFDISTDARPGQIRRIFRNSRTIGRRFRLVQVFYRGNKIIEVSTLRSHSEYDNKESEVLQANNTFGTLEEDAFRRDLTINGLFYEIENNTIIDYVGGLADLDNGIVRMIGEPEVRITRDPVRMLRALRHAARTGFTVEEKTWQAIVAGREKLLLCPPARIRDEVIKDLVSGYSVAWLEKCMESNLFFTIFPFYSYLLDEEDELSFLKSMLQVIDRLQPAGAEDKVKIPEYMLLGVLLYPWLEKELKISQRELARGGYHELMIEIRSLLDKSISSRFNLKRGVKDSLAIMLVNQSNFLARYQQKQWPRYLQKKSYFKDCLRFCAIIIEARGGEKVDEALFVSYLQKKKKYSAVVPPPAVSGGNGESKKNHRRSQGQPAFSSEKGGVFGLSKRKTPMADLIL